MKNSVKYKKFDIKDPEDSNKKLGMLFIDVKLQNKPETIKKHASETL